MKYNLSIGAIFNNEADSLEEWINHYLSIGVDHFYLINDKSSDNYLDIIKKYYKYITLTNVEDSAYYFGRQSDIYNIHLKNRLNETKWISLLDIDEYLWSPIQKNISLILEKLPENIICINTWSVCFGSNNYKKQPKGIVKNFTKRESLPKKNDSIYKSLPILDLLERNLHKQILRAKNLKKFYVHQHDLYHQDKDHKLILDFYNIENNIFRINHYRLQSKEKWEKNLKKIDVNDYKPKEIYALNSIIGFSELEKKYIYSEKLKKNYKNLPFLYEKLDKIYNQESDYSLVNLFR